MFDRNKHKIKSLTKTENSSRLFITVIFVFSFLLILFNKTDYVIVNKIKSAGIDIITPVTAFITAPVKVVVNISEEINEIRYLKNQNLKLKEEVLRLKKWQTLALKNQRENKVYKKLLNSTTLDPYSSKAYGAYSINIIGSLLYKVFVKLFKTFISEPSTSIFNIILFLILFFWTNLSNVIIFVDLLIFFKIPR